MGGDFEDWGGCGADLVLFRGFESCGSLPRLKHSGLENENVRVRVRDGDETGDFSSVLGAVPALALSFWEDDDFEDWGRCGADLVLTRGFESCGSLPRLAHSRLENDNVRVRVRDSG